MKKNNFHYVAVLLDLIYGVEMEDEDLEELGLLAWEKIGNLDIRFYKFCAMIDPTDLSITLPCNAIYNDTGAEGGIVEAVTSAYEDWERNTNKSDLGNLNSAFVENAIEAEKYYQGHYYIPGKLLKYHQVGDKLYFTHNYGRVNVLYKGLVVDEDGLPELTDKEANAIATYLAWIDKQKEGLKTNNVNLLKISLELYGMWLRQCDLARVTYLNQNDMNNILDVKNTWGRHVFNRTGTKPIL